MTRLSIGQRAWLIGSESEGQIVGVAWRNGGIVYALRGLLECGRLGWWWRYDQKAQ